MSHPAPAPSYVAWPLRAALAAAHLSTCALAYRHVLRLAVAQHHGRQSPRRGGRSNSCVGVPRRRDGKPHAVAAPQCARACDGDCGSERARGQVQEQDTIRRVFAVAYVGDLVAALVAGRTMEGWSRKDVVAHHVPRSVGTCCCVVPARRVASRLTSHPPP